MTNRERFRRIMRFQETDRVPRIEFAAYWDETLRRWEKEGLNPDRMDEISLREDFGLDDYRQFWVEPCPASWAVPPGHGQPLIRSGADYDDLRKGLYPLQPWDPRLLEAAARGQEEGRTVIWLTLEGFFWFPRYLLGIENHLYGFYDCPELIHRINDELADYHCRMIESMGRICAPDFMTFAEDLSYNLGPMLGRDLFEEFLVPYYRRVIPLLKSRETVPFIDTDGAVTDIIPWFRDAGLEGCLPVERNAGNDPDNIRRLYPDWLMIGGVEKRTLYADPRETEAEVRARFDLARRGGYIPSVDHQTPPQVSLEQYRAYLKLLDRYCRLSGE